MGAMVADEQREPHLIDTIGPREWGWITDVSGLTLAVLTFGPPYTPRDFSKWAFEDWGYYTKIEQVVFMPVQLLNMVIFLYALMHNRGIIAAVLNFDLISKFGAVVYPFYLFHWVVTCFVLST